jgi:succinate dehydrogenase/fumarate reductase cytochrome b subunit (b558 family)
MGAFLVLHLWTNSTALLGRERFTATVMASNQLPFVAALEITFLYVPLLFHASYGVRLALGGARDPQRYPGGPERQLLQRVTGGVALLFIGFHLYQYRVQRWLGNLAETDFHDELAASLSSTAFGIPWNALGYLLGTSAVAFHFANGLIAFYHSRRASTAQLGSKVPGGARAFSVGVAASGALLFATASLVVLYFATGSRLGLPVGQ